MLTEHQYGFDEDETDVHKPEIQEAVKFAKWEHIRDPALPEPKDFEPVDFGKYFSLRHFRGTGLQVIVKMASIELTPENPDFPAGGWHVSTLFCPRSCGASG